MIKKARPSRPAVSKVARPYFGREDLVSDDRFGRALNNYSKKSPYSIRGTTSLSLIKRGK